MGWGITTEYKYPSMTVKIIIPPCQICIQKLQYFHVISSLIGNVKRTTNTRKLQMLRHHRNFMQYLRSTYFQIPPYHPNKIMIILNVIIIQTHIKIKIGMTNWLQRSLAFKRKSRTFFSHITLHIINLWCNIIVIRERKCKTPL